MRRVSRPTLRTGRLELRPLTREHTEALVELDSDLEVMRFLTGRPSTRAEVVDTWLPRRTDPSHDARGLGYWVGLDGDELLGWFCLTPWRDDPDVGELGYRLRRTAWGGGTPSRVHGRWSSTGSRPWGWSGCWPRRWR